MQKSIILLFATLIIAGCQSNPKQIAKAGADKDEHGCIGSAGSTWSVLKNECVQVFQAGTQFTAYGTNNDSTMAAYIILSNDQTKAEAFLPSNYSKTAVILDEVNSSKKENNFTLYENKKEMFKIDFSKNKYIISFKNEAIFCQNYSKKEGLGKLLK
jgi:hypothetical protein